MQYLPPHEQIKDKTVNTSFSYAINGLKPWKKLVEQLGIPDEVKQQKLFSGKNDCTEETYQKIYMSFSNKPFYIPLITDDRDYNDMIRSSFKKKVGKELDIIKEFFKLVKEDNWTAIEKLPEKSFKLFVGCLDYKERAAVDWARELNCFNVLNGLYQLFPEKQHDLSFKIMCGQYSLEEIHTLDGNDLIKHFNAVLRFGHIELIKTWIAQAKQKALDRFDLYSANARCIEATPGGVYSKFPSISILKHVIQWGRADVVEILFNELMESGKNKPTDNPKITNCIIEAWEEAICTGHYEIVHFLSEKIKFKSDHLNFSNKAAASGQLEMCALLVKKGFSYKQDEHGKYPRDNAKNNKHEIPYKFEILHIKETMIKKDFAEVLNCDDINSKAITKEEICEFLKWRIQKTSNIAKKAANSVKNRFISDSNQKKSAKKVMLEEITKLEGDLTSQGFRNIVNNLSLNSKSKYFEAFTAFVLEKLEAQENAATAQNSNNNNCSKITPTPTPLPS